MQISMISRSYSEIMDLLTDLWRRLSRHAPFEFAPDGFILLFPVKAFIDVNP